jgi:tRNA (guanine37-N1)-methyltransferase
LIEKSQASVVINILKKADLIDANFRIANQEDSVIIPLQVEKIDNPHEIISQYIADIKFQAINYPFEPKTSLPNSFTELLKSKLPSNVHVDLPTSFDQIGNIAVIDIKDDMIKYKSEIGQAILTIHQSIQSVFRKSSKVNGEYRIRGIELIAGENNTITVHKEYGLSFKVDIAQVYFSPRLATEHRRIAQQVSPDEYVLDMFGGIAPFALHIAQLQPCNITTVDINPSATKLIAESLKLNKHLLGEIHCLEGDIDAIAQSFLEKNQLFDRIIMNHPSNAISYLSLARQLLVTGGLIHFYIFAPEATVAKDAQKLVQEFLPNSEVFDIHAVRQSSPSEFHYCITLRSK